MLKKITLAASVLALCACSGGPGTEKWCAAKKEEPKSQWSADDAKTYAQKCLLDSTTIGSDSWCEKMKEKESDKMSVEEAKDFAKHCVI